MSSLRRTTSLIGGILLSAFALSAGSSIDYLADSVSPDAKFSGNSGTFHVIEPVGPGGAIEFTLTSSIKKEGGTTQFPQIATFGVQNFGKPDGAAAPAVTLGDGPLFTYKFEKATDKAVIQVSITAPDTPGAYHVKIRAATDDGKGLNPGSGIVVHFVVAAPDQIQVPTTLTLSLDNTCLVYHTESVLVRAKLETATTPPQPIPNMPVTFSLDLKDPQVASSQTDANGFATLMLDTHALAVGDYTLSAAFQGAAVGNTVYGSSSDSATLGIKYDFRGFGQPINGSKASKGNSVPVKIQIADAYEASVPDAQAHLFYTLLSSSPAGTETAADSQSGPPDTGNTMRYDDGQYIFNWNISGLSNGTYQLRVGLGEGTCAPPRTVQVSIDRNQNSATAKSK